MQSNIPTILVIGGHDPTGGAGIQADIETIKSLNCHPVTLITCLTSQNTYEFKNLIPVDSNFFREQANLLISDVNIDYIKIGAIGSINIANEIIKILKKIKKKVILDPIISASMGGKLTHSKLQKKIKEEIFPLSYLITPNADEAIKFSKGINLQNPDWTFSINSKNILLKDIHPKENRIINQLYLSNKLSKQWSIKRSPKNYHGTGCTLAAGISAFLAQKNNLEKSIDLALKFVKYSMKDSFELGKGQRILRRVSTSIE
tara:strand:+ start:5370 stop:6149 length:780 start_codon:yes stop_codon:yes gene_type:complete